jgi:MFS family permease
MSETPNTDQLKPVRYQNYIAIGLVTMLVGLAMATVQNKVPTILLPIRDLFGMDAQTASWLMSIPGIMTIFFAIPAGILSRKFNPKYLIGVGGGLAVLGTLVGISSHEHWVIILSRAIEGGAATFTTTCVPILIQRCVLPSRIGSAMGIMSIWGSAGTILSSLTAPTLFLDFGFVVTWLVYAMVIIIAIIVMFLYVRMPKTPTTGDQGGAAAPVPKFKLREFFVRDVVIYFGGITGVNVCLVANLSYVPSLLQLQNVSPAASGVIITIPLLLAFISTPLYGIISDKIGRSKPILIINMVAFAISSLLLYTQTGVWLYVGAALMGLVGMGAMGMILTVFTKLVPREDMITVGLGIFTATQGVGQFLGTFVVQLLLGPDLARNVLAGVVIMCLGLLGAFCVSLCRVREVGPASTD